jgi:hypothetical protein
MSGNTIIEKLRSLGSKVKGRIVQDCPPHLFACEICGAHDCDSEAWLNCQNRIKAADFMKSGNREALTELKQRCGTATPARSCKI